MAGRKQDRGWAWMVTFAVMLQNFFVVGLLKSFGILFVQFRDTFHATASMTSAVLGMQAAAFCLAAPICLHLFARKYSYRQLMFFGAITSSTGIAISSVATDMVHLLFSCGAMIGVGNAFMHGPSLVMIGQYFNRRLSLANSIAIGGGSLGQFAFPPLVYFLFDTYGLRGTLLMIAGLMLHCCVCAAIMRPFRIATCEPQQGQCEECQSLTSHQSLQEEEDEQGKEKDLVQTVITCKHAGLDVENVDMNEKYPQVNLKGTRSTQEAKAGSNFHHDKDNRNICCSTNLIGLSLCWNPVFVLLEIASALANVGSTLQTIYIVPHSRDLGFDEKMTSLLVTIIGAADIVGKLCCGVLADTGWIKRYKLLVISLMISGTLGQFMSFFSSTTPIILYCVVIGLVGGCYFSLLTPVLIDFLGIDNLPRSLGITLCCEGIASTVAPVLLGYLKDSTGTYLASFHLLGSFLFVASLSLICTKFVKGSPSAKPNE
ncbi:monocarboxylate transporter 13-like isoform X2 [Haliotis rufescens]|uniref:monocarboxylate transporter 13-like isoform X2 n=1 Tax=Haliotis rufescens TaxID=6454 RepID=UPI001EB02EA1|nr:monocarboxylate transporter 13-like isoform X2 [Haliotis rufescens]XP_046363203.1 monocarboxylate transporter 13-like isoform X2 [Haliotis rufescens]XP_048258630.1 monocarboxylate transporter 13-like isoform X2 [Haliotis rufescens]XP_048258631.1 monocarboxylate transporter 13-like isoform X2 [Haliotis rufescens]